MFKTVILPLAKKDIKEAATWYNNRQNGLGMRFTTEVRERIQFIKSNPHSVAIRYDNIRTLPLQVFPYMIHFELDLENKLIVISAVFHTSQNSKNWENR